MIKSPIIALLCLLTAAIAAERVSEMNVTWTTPGKSAADSMPLGNGSLGINLWVEAGGPQKIVLAADQFPKVGPDVVC